MQLELHIIQNFAPSNLNRDDTGSPKSCEFGGYRRARVSSQSIKRAIRTEFREQELIDAGRRADRSKRFVQTIIEQLGTKGRPADEARQVAEAALNVLNINLADAEKTQYLLYFAPSEIEAIVEFCEAQWDRLAGAEKRGKKEKRDSDTKKLADALKSKLDGGKAADLALFGRMLADLPERNIDAAAQVAHAISTHQVAIEFDYYTAVDDLKPEDTAGADMIGTVEFNSACYYRYGNVDLEQLRENLGNDDELVAEAVRAFLQASVDAIPTGKQNSFAARNAPSFVMTVLRNSGAWSLANAFVQPVRATAEVSLVDASIVRLDEHWRELTTMYGAPAGHVTSFAALGVDELPGLGRAVPVATVIDTTVRTACPAGV